MKHPVSGERFHVSETKWWHAGETGFKMWQSCFHFFAGKALIFCLEAWIESRVGGLLI